MPVLNLAEKKIQDLKKEENRKQILLAEISALLHDLGKLSDDFLIQQSSEVTKQYYFYKHNLILGRSIKFPYIINSSINFNEEDIVSISDELYKNIKNSTFVDNEKIKNIIKDLIITRFSIHPNDDEISKILNLIYEYNSYNSLKVSYSFAKNLEALSLNVKGKKVTFADILAKHHGGENYSSDFSPEFIKLFKNIDGVDSGVDKGSLHNNGKQSYLSANKSTSFGYEIKLPSFEVSSCLSLGNLMDGFCKGSLDVDKFRAKIYNINTSISNEGIKTEFIKALGETRRSGNDVTLWDHSYSVASLYKSSIAKIICDGKFPSRKELKSIKWKIIGVQYDKFQLIEKANKLSDIAAYRSLANKIDESVKKIIEEKIPIGNEIYRDETGIYFVGPDIEDVKFWDRIKKEITSKINKLSNGEVIPNIEISDQTRSMVILTEMLKESRLAFFNSEIPNWTKKWTGILNKDICPICKVHPKKETEDSCIYCLRRRERRIKKWKENKYQTIWIDEIADSNKNAAIITGRFNLDNWLNGELLNTVFSQTLDDYNDEVTNWSNLINKLDEELEKDEQNSQVLSKIANEAYHRISARSFYDEIVVDRNPSWTSDFVMEDTDWNDGKKRRIATERLLLTIFRKHPSPSRLRRIWTSTEDFWIEIQNELKEDQNIYSEFESKKKIENRFKRLEVILDESFTGDKGIYHLKFNSIDLLSYYDNKDDDKKFVSIQNLQHSGLHKEELSTYKQINIKSEDEKDSEFKSYKIKKISFSENSYRPFLEVLLSPITFQFIVPANSAPAVIKKIKKKYDTEMGNVSGRLPLNLGVVFFDYKTALYATVNASRRMLKGFENVDFMDFSVISNNSSTIDLETNNLGARKKKIQLNRGSDAQAKYYFNFLIDSPEDEARNRESFFKTFINKNQEHLINGVNLSSEDCIKLYPNYFDFELLDSTARRLEIIYKGHERIRKSSIMGPRPYLLEEFSSVFEQVWKLFDKSSMTTSQLKNIQENLVKLHMDWKGCETQTEYEEVFKKQIENILINVGTRKWWDSLDEKGKKLLKEVCLDKTVFDIMEFYNSILKLKPSGDKNE